MFRLLILPLLLLTWFSFAIEIPIADGKYIFNHKYAEQPEVESITFEAVIKGRSIVLINKSESKVFPKGIIEQGEIFWHSQTEQWIIISTEIDKTTPNVGGCSGGPTVIDFQNMIYWSC